MLGWKESQKIAKQYRLPVSKAVLVKKEEDAVKAAKKLFPVALKIVSKDIIHKSDVGGVAVGLSCEADIRKAFREIIRSVKKKRPQAKIDGVLVQKMASGIELIVGAKIDEQFGPVVMFGAGGVMVEVMNDVAFRVAPISAKEAEKMVRETMIYKILAGSRGKKYNTKGVADTILKASKIITSKKIKELDFNPVIANQETAEIVDLRLIK
jgi:acyl-CoA synthetase (NDP forming)